MTMTAEERAALWAKTMTTEEMVHAWAESANAFTGARISQKDLDILTGLIRAAENDALERAAQKLEEWLSASTLRLHCGELSAGEARLVQAVLRSRAAAIRALKQPETRG